LVQASVILATSAVFEEPEVGLFSFPRSRIMPCASKCDTISADETNVYREGIIGNHLAVVGIERIMIPRQVSSEIALVLRLSTAALRVRRSLIWSCILVPSAYMVLLSNSWA